jgi:hypothetical protein
MQNSDSELLKNLIHERLKHVDSLVKNSKLEEAAKEVSEIRKLDPKNPYALAFEERILSLQGTPVVKEDPASVLPKEPYPLCIRSSNSPGSSFRCKASAGSGFRESSVNQLQGPRKRKIHRRID